MKRSFKKKNVDSTEDDSQSQNDHQPIMMNATRVAQILAKPHPLRTTKNQLDHSQSIDYIESEFKLPKIDEFAHNENNNLTQIGLDIDSAEKVPESLSVEPKGILLLFY